MSPFSIFARTVTGVFALVAFLYAFSPQKDKISIPLSMGYLTGDTVVIEYGKVGCVKIGSNVYTITSPTLELQNGLKLPNSIFYPYNGLSITPTIDSLSNTIRSRLYFSVDSSCEIKPPGWGVKYNTNNNGLPLIPLFPSAPFQ